MNDDDVDGYYDRPIKHFKKGELVELINPFGGYWQYAIVVKPDFPIGWNTIYLQISQMTLTFHHEELRKVQ